LDAIRGIAAVMVVVHHGVQSLPWAIQDRIWAAVRDTPLLLILMGRPFVIIFFVLSGFVLTVSVTGDPAFSYRGFAIKRLFRIYLPYLASLLFSVCIYACIRPFGPNAPGDWLGITWQGGITASTLAGNIALLGTPSGSFLNNVNWSLVYELRISLLFPLMIWLFTRLGAARGCAITLIVAAAADAAMPAAGLPLQPYSAGTVAGAVVLTLHFVTAFAAGALLAMTIRDWQPPLARLRSCAGWLAELAGLVLAGVCLSIRDDSAQALGAAVLIAVALSGGWVSTTLRHRVPLFLGRISYSLYLVHVPILAGLTHFLYQRVDAAAVPVLAFFLSIPVAIAANEWVEQPAKRAGRRWAARLATPRAAIQPAALS
jgi:peptidoglycan/LPS O-acetylase OafA/YrhL